MVTITSGKGHVPTGIARYLERMAQNGRMLSNHRLAELLGIADHSLRKIRARHSGPPFFRLGGDDGKRGKVLYDPLDVLAWLQERAAGLPPNRETTSDAA